MDKEAIFKNKNKSNDLSLNKIFNNKIPNISPKNVNKLNYNSEDNSSSKNFNDKNSYFNYRRKLFKKCNSRILENKEILPILSSKKSHNNLDSSKIEKSKNKISLKKIPIKNLKNSLNQKKAINISILSDLNNKNVYKSQKLKEKSESMNNLLKIKKSKSLIQLDNNEENKKENNSNSIEIFSSSSKKINFHNLEDLKNNDINIINNNSKIAEKKSKDLRFSEFFRYSKNRNVSAHKIYEHYKEEEINNKVIPIDNFTKFLEQKFSSPKKRLYQLYGIDKLHINNIEELKNNKSIAFKEDFNIQEYQKILLGMVKKRIGPNSLFDLKQNFQKFNDKVLRGFVTHKGRYTKLADKIGNSAPMYLINKLQKLDNEKIMEKAKFLKVSVNKKKEKKPVDEFELYLENKFVPDIDIEKKF